MSSFSLARRFGKEQKVTIDSPASSSLVGQHVGHPVLGSSHSGTRQDLPTVNFPSESTVNNSHGLLSGSVALSQHVEGVSIRNINAPVMSNNHVHITTNYYGSKTNFEDSNASVFLVFKSVASGCDLGGQIY
ncbi:hypothetical protein C8J56DRAFT_1026463 [Mycena floridula]|nr:hypothetical protein C8J56DRAFT_1026463 [Mycena floridula]